MDKCEVEECIPLASGDVLAKCEFHEWMDSNEKVDGIPLKECKKCGLKMHKVNWDIFYR